MRTFGWIVLSAVVLGALLGWGLGQITSNGSRWVWTLEEAGIKLPKEKTEEPSAPVEDSAPKVRVVEPIYDFGILEKNERSEKGEHGFIIENVGGSELTLKEGGKACMCTSFSISKSSLRKGEKATVTVRWDASRGGGVFDQSVRVSTNDPFHKEVYLTVHGLYTSPIIANPNQLVFNGVSLGSEATREFKIFGFEKNKDGSPFELLIDEYSVSDAEHFRIELKKGSLEDCDESERTHKLLSQATNVFLGKLTLLPGLSQGAFQQVLRFRTNEPKLPLFEMMVEGQITGSITITGVRFDRLGSGQLTIGSVSSRNGSFERLRMTIVDKYDANEKTVRLKKVRPDWLKVRFKYPDPKLQKSMPVKMIDVEVEIPKGASPVNFMGPTPERLGELVFEVGPQEDCMREIVIPIQFAVGP